MDSLSVFLPYLNVFPLIWAGIKFGFVGLFISIILLIILKKKVNIARSNKFLRYLAYSYWLYMPVVVLCGSFIYGMIQSAQEQIKVQLPAQEQSIQNVINHYVNDDTLVVIDMNKSVDEIIDMAMPAIKNYLTQEVIAQSHQNDKWASYIFMALDSSYASYFIKEQLKSTIAKYTSTDKQFVNHFLTLTPRQILSGEMVVKVIEYYVLKFFSGLKLKTVIISTFLLLIPIIEIIIANCRCRRLKK